MERIGGFMMTSSLAIADIGLLLSILSRRGEVRRAGIVVMTVCALVFSFGALMIDDAEAMLFIVFFGTVALSVLSGAVTILRWNSISLRQSTSVGLVLLTAGILLNTAAVARSGTTYSALWSYVPIAIVLYAIGLATSWALLEAGY